MTNCTIDVAAERTGLLSEEVSKNTKLTANQKCAVGGSLALVGLGVLALSGTFTPTSLLVEPQMAVSALSPAVGNVLGSAKKDFTRNARTAAAQPFRGAKVSASARSSEYADEFEISTTPVYTQAEQGSGHSFALAVSCAMGLGLAGYAAKKKFTAAATSGIQMSQAPSVSTHKAENAKSMQVWRPDNNKFFETFSYLPPLSDQEIGRQVQYLLNNGWTPCIEFEGAEKAYSDTHGSTGIDFSVNAGYYDNRYWTMWKLPMYGCTSPDEVLQEIAACKSAFPDCFVKLAGFDNIKQVQCSAMLVGRPRSVNDTRSVQDRQVGGEVGHAPPASGGGGGHVSTQQQNYSW